MRIGVFAVADESAGGLEGLVAQAQQAERDGLATVWVYNIFGVDAMTALAACGRATTRIELGAAVMPIQLRHPFAMAQQALTTQAAAGGRFTLGIGVSHRPWIDDLFGLPFEQPTAHLREYMAVLAPLIRTRRVAHTGQRYRVHAALTTPEVPPCPILFSALAPRMLALAGRVADGTITAWTGPKTLRTHTVPRLAEAAARAGRPAPRVVTIFPIAVTTDGADARATAARLFAIFGDLPSYRAMLDLEGVDGPGDLAVHGDEDAIGEQLQRLGESGVTDFLALPYPVGPDAPASLARTAALLARLARDTREAQEVRAG
jgi:5,10-methylenetetrahydromethanopterin reductase